MKFFILSTMAIISAIITIWIRTWKKIERIREEIEQIRETGVRT